MGVDLSVGVAGGVGVGVDVGVGDAIAASLSKKASSWDWPLMATRPSTQEVRCFVAIAEP